MIFPPFQFPHTQLAGHCLTIEAIAGEPGPPVSAEPGSVLAVSDTGFDVAAGGGTIRITALAGADDDARAAVQTIAVGDQFGAL